MIYPKKMKIKEYEGEWAKNKRHGKGVMIMRDGGKYEGEFMNDERHGKGK